MRLSLLIATAAVALAAGAAQGSPLAASRSAQGMGGIEVIPVHDSCHQSLRTHGGYYPQHSHRDSDCAVVYAGAEGYDDDCHQNVLRHFVPGYGNVWHRHGQSCGVQLYESQGGPAPGIGGCIQIGGWPTCFGINP